MVPVCDKRYHIYNRFRHFWAEIKKLWNYPLVGLLRFNQQNKHCILICFTMSPYIADGWRRREGQLWRRRTRWLSTWRGFLTSVRYTLRHILVMRAIFICLSNDGSYYFITQGGWKDSFLCDPVGVRSIIQESVHVCSTIFLNGSRYIGTGWDSDWYLVSLGSR